MFSRWRERLRHTLGIRIAFWYAVFFVTSSLALIVITYALLAATLRHYDREIIQTTLVQFAGAFARGGRPALERELLRTQAAAHGPLFVRALGVRRDLIFVSMPEAWQQFDLSQLATPPLAGQQTWAALRTGPDGAVLEVASVRLPDGTLFQVGMSTERRTDLLSRFRRVLLVNFVAIALIGLAGGALLTRSALRPVRTLTSTVREIMRTGRTDARVPAEEHGDALGELTVLVNAMLDRIDAVVAGMRGALDNVAHDLRTPLTRLRAIAEGALQSGDPQVLAGALADCLEEADRVSAMLNTLMDISEAETGTMALSLEPVDLSQVIAEAVDLYEEMADARGQTIAIATADQLTIRGDRNRLRQVVANLIDNAVKYTPPGGRIEIDAHAEGGEAVLRVADTGPGIAPGDLPRIWDRLYRGDRSRSERGLGLGLSLVKAIVEAHGGRVEAASTPGHGARFELRLPG
jgi:signal transduction histidine kinase